jgi:hypothetical protein
VACMRARGPVPADTRWLVWLVAILTIGSLAIACSTAVKTAGDATTPDLVTDRLGSGEDANAIGDVGTDAFPGCSPGDLLEPVFSSGECVDGRCICRTYNPDGGTLVQLTGFTASTGIISYQLPQPMRAGQPYTFSFTYSNYNFTGDLQLWGSNAECGPGLQMLFAEPVGSKVYCATVHPTAAYSYLLFVENHTGKGDASSAASNMTGLTACPTATCP